MNDWFSPDSPISKLLAFLIFGGGAAGIWNAYKRFRDDISQRQQAKDKAELDRKNATCAQIKAAEHKADKADDEKEQAERERDREARARRMIEETLGATRTYCVREHGTDPADLPDWPSY